MKISPQQRKILAAISKVGAAPIPTLAKVAGYKQHAVRYALNNLLSREVIKYFPSINACALGYSAYTIYFSLASMGEREREAVLSHLVKSDITSWVAELIGDFQYATTAYVRSTAEFDLFLQSLGSRSKPIFSDRAVRVDFSLTYFPLKNFGDPRHQSAFTVWGPTESVASIDALDRKVLSLLSGSPGASHSELARRLGIPAATFAYRVQKLEEKGVINGHTYFFNTEKAGLSTFKLLIYARGLDPLFSDNLAAFVRAHPSIYLFVRCAGAWDFEVNAIFDDTSSALKLVQELHTNFAAQIKNIRTMQIVRHLKVRDFPFPE
jgi:DNA-binding Lrp family transcriptional regulator